MSDNCPCCDELYHRILHESVSSYSKERLTEIHAKLGPARRKRAKAMKVIEEVVQISLDGCSCVAHGSHATGLDHPTSDLDVVIYPKASWEGRNVLEDWRKAKLILEEIASWAQEFAPAVRCSMCGEIVSRNRILQRGGIWHCERCYSAFDDEITAIIASYSIQLVVERWARVAIKIPYERLESALTCCPNILRVEYIQSRIPIIKCQVLTAFSEETVDPSAHQEGVDVDISFGETAEYAHWQREKVIRLMSPEEKLFAPQLIRLLKDCLAGDSLDDTYLGGVGGYTALVLVFAFLRNTQVLIRKQPCEILNTAQPRPQKSLTGPRELEHEAPRSGNEMEVIDLTEMIDLTGGSNGNVCNESAHSAEIAREVDARNALMLGYLGNGNYAVELKVGSLGDAEVLVIPSEHVNRISVLQLSGRTLDFLFQELCKFLDSLWVENVENFEEADENLSLDEEFSHSDGESALAYVSEAWMPYVPITIGSGNLTIWDPEDTESDLGEQVHKFSRVQSKLRDMWLALKKHLELKSNEAENQGMHIEDDDDRSKYSDNLVIEIKNSPSPREAGTMAEVKHVEGSTFSNESASGTKMVVTKRSPTERMMMRLGNKLRNRRDASRWADRR